MLRLAVHPGTLERPVRPVPPVRVLAVLAAVVMLPVGGLARSPASVPAPKDLAADVIVSGRTSTARRVDVVRMGNEIPPTFSGGMVKNSTGFAWFISRHYALKTDYPEAKARFYLMLLELAYPHCVELFGREPPEIDRKRMACVYASSKDRLARALAGDGISWDFHGGGITFEGGYRCAYVYPSGSLEYHQRYILLHEATHLYQMCLAGTTYNTPAWYYEGVAEALAHHVYDTQARRLTVHVLDKPTTLNYLDIGLREFQDGPMTPEEIHRKGSGSRGRDFLMAHFFLDDPDRAMRLRLWRDDMFARPKYDAARAAELLQKLFGPWSAINADFLAWRTSLRQTFHYAEWGWEQEADTLWSYGFAEGGRLSQTDVYLSPDEAASYSPLRMDWPLAGGSPLVGPVRRGGQEPSVAAVIDFSRNPHRGRAGIGMGLVEPERLARGVRHIVGPRGAAGASTRDAQDAPGLLKLLIEGERRLIIDGADLGMGRREVDLPKELQAALASGGHRVGLTVRIGKAALALALRAGRDSPGPMPNTPTSGPGTAAATIAAAPTTEAASGQARGLAVFQTSIPIDDAQRRRLLSRPLSILARDGYHGVTPFFDDGRRAEPDLGAPAPPNRWRNPGDRQLEALYRAEWRLGAAAPASLKALKKAMLAAVDKGPAEQREALAAFGGSIAAVRRDIRSCPADKAAIASAEAAIEQAMTDRAPAAPR